MARCAYCGTETKLYDGQTPICVACRETSVVKPDARATLFQELTEATKRAEAAANAFASVTNDISSGIPHPDGMQRIRNAAREMEIASREMMQAHSRLTEFIERGTLPDDLKRSE